MLYNVIQTIYCFKINIETKKNYMKAQDYNFIIYLILKFIHVSIYLFRHLYTIYEFVESMFLFNIPKIHCYLSLC